MQHTKTCQDRQGLSLVLTALFQERYPTYCRRCDGWGKLPEMWDGPVKRDMAPSFLVIEAPCPACEGSALPHCGLCGQILDSDGFRLCLCPLNVGKPQAPQCFCWEETL